MSRPLNRREFFHVRVNVTLANRKVPSVGLAGGISSRNFRNFVDVAMIFIEFVDVWTNDTEVQL